MLTVLPCDKPENTLGKTQTDVGLMDKKRGQKQGDEIKTTQKRGVNGNKCVTLHLENNRERYVTATKDLIK